MTMVHRLRLALLVFTLTCVAAFSQLFLFQPVLTAHAATAGGHVTILILDMSGSMAQNDPNGLRCSAANAYIDLSGVGGSIGIIGLDNNDNATGGPHGFQKAQVWTQPLATDTQAERDTLRQIIDTKSNHCRPDQNTPTYDALDQSLTMLDSATKAGNSGSVILLTDGVPAPNQDEQLNAITTDLAPRFKSRGWPVDTIALGSDTTSHGFLGDLANGSSGKFYDDSKGPVAGVSPLNLEHFFVDIFQIRNGRTPGATIPATQLNGSSQQNFSVGNFVSHLDVIVVKDQPTTTITITAPNGQTFPPAASGTFVATDPHYVIFSIDSPQPGNWQLNATGSGLFLMDSLIQSRLELAVTSPQKGKSEPLGQPVTISASLRDSGNAVVGGSYALTAHITYVGSDKGTITPVELLLNDANNSGNYTGTVTIPLGSPTGSYEIDVTAKAASENAVSAQTVAQFGVYPTAILIDPTTQKPTKDTINTQVVTWDPGLRFTYNLPILGWSIFGWHPSDLPLQGKAANSQALVNGQVLVGTATYSKATVRATAVKDGSTTPVAVQVVNDNNGNFRLLFPENAKGHYTVNLTSTGAYKDSYGDLTASTGSVGVTIGLPSLADEIRAWLITLLYLLILAIVALFGIYGPVNYLVRAKPNARNRLIDVAANLRARSRSDLHSGVPIVWHGWSLRRYFAPHRLPASELSLPNNLLFVFRRGNEVAIKVRKTKKKEPGAVWSIDGRQLTAADGTATIVSNSRIAYAELGQKTEWKFEQDVSGSGNLDNNYGNTGGIRDQIEDAAGKLNLRDRLRQGRGLRND